MLENDAEITRCIRRLIPVNELDVSLQNQLIQQSDLLELETGQYLFRQGDSDQYSYYLLYGEIDMISDQQIQNTISSDTERARHAMAHLQPRTLSARAKIPGQVLRLNRHTLDKLLVLSRQNSGKIDLSDTISGPGKLEVAEIEDQAEDMDWMTRLLQSDLFARMPTANIQKLFALLDEEYKKAGEVIVEQGQSNSTYYIIQEGRCVVTRKAKPESNPIKLAQLSAGESFGEESLLMDTSCNATVTMQEDGILMKLSKEHFVDLIKKPTLVSLDTKTALEQIQAGAKWLDVRFATEFKQGHIDAATNIPLNLLRIESHKLDTGIKYIAYCDTGGRSSAAAFLLAERGFNTGFLEGGLISNAGLIDDIDQLQTENTSAQANKQQQLDPVIKATDIDAKLECTNMKLKDIEKMRQQVSQVEAETQRQKLLSDKQKLEAEKSIASKAAKKQRNQEQEQIKKLEETREHCIKQNQKEIAGIYQSSTIEMEKFQQLKKEYQKELDREKQVLLEKQKQAEKMLAEASLLKQQVARSKQQLLEKSIKQKRLQIEQEKKRQLELKQKLQMAYQKVTDELAQLEVELEQAKNQMNQAEKDRYAARQEADKMVARLKQGQQDSRHTDGEKLKQQQKRLKLQSGKIDDNLKKLEIRRIQAMRLEEQASEQTKQQNTQKALSPEEEDTVKLLDEVSSQLNGTHN